MMIMGLSGHGLAGLGFTEYDPCTNAVNGDGMSSGEACTLPDGNDIAIWNGSNLTLPDGSAVDDVNAAALVAAGWSANKLGASGGSSGSGSSWWDGLVNAASQVAKGYAAGSVPPPKPVAKTPWYMTPIGIVGILGLLGIGTFAVMKK